MSKVSQNLNLFILCCAALVSTAEGQQFSRVLTLQSGGRIKIENLHGRVEVVTESGDQSPSGPYSLTATSNSAISATDIKIEADNGGVKIEVDPANQSKRIDLSIRMPDKMRIEIETAEGEVRLSGDFISADVTTATGTIAADVPTDDLRYEFHWTASKPRFLSDIGLAKVKEKAAGRFEIVGRIRGEKPTRKGSRSEKEDKVVPRNDDLDKGMIPPEEKDGREDAKSTGDQKDKAKKKIPGTIALNFTTARGIILLNIPPNEVTGDLRERPLTTAAKAIIRSGDSLLMDAIRRAAPKFYGDYTRTLPPIKLEPTFSERHSSEKGSAASIKVAFVRVNDLNNRSVPGLEPGDFELTENNQKREIISVEPATTPFNLVLLVDVSGSVDNYVNFIRKAARSFVDTVDARDRISIVTFNDDVKVLSGFTTDKRRLSESLDTFDAGGATAYYDALAYTLADTLRPLKGERTAIVVLTDGDDNRSFLPFDSMLASIQESGALIYPLYVPSGLIAASDALKTDPSMDALRTRYLQGELSSKAQSEGKRLADVSGGVYYPITQLSQIQTAYDEIAAQLRTAYTIKFRSDTIDIGSGVSPHLKVKVNKPNAFATVGSVAVAK